LEPTLTAPRGCAAVMAGASAAAAVAAAGVATAATAAAGAGVAAGTAVSEPFGSVGTSTTGAGSGAVDGVEGPVLDEESGASLVSGTSRSAAGIELSLRRDGAVESPEDVAPTRPRARGEASLLSAELSSDAEVLPTPERVPARCGVRFDGELELLAPDAESEALEPVDPADPVVSAKAIGIAEMPEPTPRATARAPTRPM